MENDIRQAWVEKIVECSAPPSPPLKCSETILLRRHVTAHLQALAVVEHHVAQLFGHHVQMSLLALVGSGQHVHLGEVWRQVVEGSA